MLIFSFICSILFMFVFIGMISMLIYSYYSLKRQKKKAAQDLQEIILNFGGTDEIKKM